MARILISGASGLIGSAFVASFESRGNEVIRLVRHASTSVHEIRWDPMRPIPPELISGFNAVIHLSGESVAGRWTESKKSRIRESRVVSTQNLSNALAKAKKPPTTFICASAIGYYGNRGDEILNEGSSSGAGLLAEVCREWESATAQTADADIRTVSLRIGIVLSSTGGALKQMLLPFRLGLGGKIGSGQQWWSWIHIHDLVSAIQHIVQHDGLRGAVNLTAPNAVNNTEFTKTLAGVLNRPAVLPIPAFAARLAFGELADEGLLASARVVPEKLVENGFEFKYPELGEALRDLLLRVGQAQVKSF